MKTITSFRKGFTLIELLIIIAIIAILAGVVFVALDPLTRFRDARNSRRWADIASILSATRVDQVDNGGRYIWAIRQMTVNTPYMIAATTSPSGSACVTPADVTCAVSIGATNCVQLQGLADEGYLGTIPVSPNGTGSWTSGGNTGYYLRLNGNNSVTAGACESEGASSISVTR